LKELFDTRELAFRPTAKAEAVERYGVDFVNRFPEKPIGKGKEIRTRMTATMYDAHVGVSVSIGPRHYGERKLGFTEDSVIIEAIQGEKNRHMAPLNQRLGMPWANYLLHQIEENARVVGKKFVHIRRPETLLYYQRPAFPRIPEYDPEDARRTNPEYILAREALQERMKELYYSVARRGGYKKVSAEFMEKRVG
jgi:hypothetical protein